MPNQLFVELVARHSFEWKDEFRFTFIWNDTFIIGNYDRDRRWISILTYLEQEEKVQAVSWLEQFILKELLEEEETEEEDEEDRN